MNNVFAFYMSTFSFSCHCTFREVIGDDSQASSGVLRSIRGFLIRLLDAFSDNTTLRRCKVWATLKRQINVGDVRFCKPKTWRNLSVFRFSFSISRCDNTVLIDWLGFGCKTTWLELREDLFFGLKYPFSLPQTWLQISIDIMLTVQMLWSGGLPACYSTAIPSTSTSTSDTKVRSYTGDVNVIRQVL